MNVEWGDVGEKRIGWPDGSDGRRRAYEAE
jgi:hypothetical protein